MIRKFAQMTDTELEVLEAVLGTSQRPIAYALGLSVGVEKAMRSASGTPTSGPPPSWRDVLDTKEPGLHIDAANKQAVSLGYKYFAFNGDVYVATSPCNLSLKTNWVINEGDIESFDPPEEPVANAGATP